MNLSEILSDAVPIIEKVTPILATELGKPTSLALVVLSALFEIFGQPSKNNSFDFAKLVQNIQNDPDVESKLKEIEEIHKANT